MHSQDEFLKLPTDNYQHFKQQNQSTLDRPQPKVIVPKQKYRKMLKELDKISDQKSTFQDQIEFIKNSFKHKEQLVSPRYTSL